MTGIRLLHVISGLGTGGAERFLAQLAPQLAERGLAQRIVCVSDEGPMSDVFRLQGLQLDHLGLSGITGTPAALRKLAAISQEFAPDVIQGWMYHGDLFATIARRSVKMAGTGQRPALLWNIRCSDMDLTRYALQLRVVVRACARLSGTPDVIIANSEAGGRSHAAAGYKPRRLEIIRNGVDTDRFQPAPDVREEVRTELGFRSNDTVVMHVARVDPMKDHVTFLQAIAPIRNTKVILVGMGTQELHLPKNAMALGRRDDVDRLLHAGDVIVSSSAYGEGFSNALAEGMACGLVPVATNVGDSAITVGEAGRVVPPGNAETLQKAIEDVIRLPGSELAELKSAARRQIAKFDISAAVDAYDALYRELASSPTAAASPTPA